MSYTTTAGIQLKDSDFPLLTETIMTQVGITKNDQTIPFSRLVQLNTALDALQPVPPNATTMWLDNTILLDTASSPNLNYTTLSNTTLTITDATGTPIIATLDKNRLQLTNGTTTPYIELNGSNQLWIENGNTYPIILNSTNSQITIGDVGNAGNFTRIAVDDTTRTNEINSVDIVSNCGTGSSPNYILPIQFTNKTTGNYTLNNGNNWEMVASNTINIPLQLLTLTNGYNVWKMDFAINCYNMTNQSDKAYAMYIEIRDVNGSSIDYQGFLFNQNIPFTTHKNNSTYTATNSQIENYCYTDYYDFTGATGSPLEIRLWRYADNPMSCDFSWLLTLSKTNLV